MLKFLSSFTLGLLFFYTLQAQDNRAVLSAFPQKPVVEVIYMQEAKPVNAEMISELIIKPNSSHCGINELLENAKYQATIKGGNAIYVKSISAPGPKEYCFGLEAEIYNIQEPYTSRSNPDFPSKKLTTSKEGTIILTEIFPEFPGGTAAMLNFLMTNVRYPASALKDKVSGKVTVVCVIDPTGKLTDISVLEGVRQDIDQEAIRVVSLMPEWAPGFQNGKAVPVKYTIPIRFGIQGKVARKKKAE